LKLLSVTRQLRSGFSPQQWIQLSIPAELRGTWVPLAEDAQYLELQVWYPPEILTSGEGDRCYRFQLELDNDGIVDQKDTLISSLNTNSLSVQKLGGRDQAVAVLVPY
jgi:hypothetical protein